MLQFSGSRLGQSAGLICALLTAAVCGCGGSTARHSGTTLATRVGTTPASTPAPTTEKALSEPRAPRHKAPHHARPVKPPPGPTPKRVPTPVPKHGDRSIQTYGSAPSNAEFVAVANTVREYELAVASKDTSTACELLAGGVKKTLLQLYSRAAAGKTAGCPQVLSALFKAQPPSLASELRKVRVTDARLKGDTGFAIYTMPGTGRAALPIRREGGRWKVAGIAGAPLQ